MSAVVSASVLRAIREAAAEVPNSEVPAVELRAIVADSLQDAVDLALISGYRARTAKMLDVLVRGMERGEPLGFLDATPAPVVGELNPVWIGQLVWPFGPLGPHLPHRGIDRA